MQNECKMFEPDALYELVRSRLNTSGQQTSGVRAQALSLRGLVSRFALCVGVRCALRKGTISGMGQYGEVDILHETSEILEAGHGVSWGKCSMPLDEASYERMFVWAGVSEAVSAL